MLGMTLDDQHDDAPALAYILLAEDEVLIRALLAEELRGYGLVVVEAADADEAWDYLQAGGRADLIFSDVRMPGSMSGMDLIRRVRQSFPDIKAVLMSGNPGPGNPAELGVYLPKPYRLADAARLAFKLLGLPGGP